MEKRLVEAFDQITMPESCVRKIQQQLSEPPAELQRYTLVLNQRKKRSWKGMLTAVCALLLLVTVPLAYFRNAEQEAVPEFTAPHSTEATEGTVDQEGLPFWEEGLEILDHLCLTMPDWMGYASLEDSFWTELVVRILNDYVVDKNGILQTQAGDASLVGGRIRMDRDTLSGYIEKIMGLPLPEFTPCGEYGGLLSYEGGAYYASNTVFSNLSYSLKDWENGSFPEVTYSIHPAPGGEELGTVTFFLSPGQQEGEYMVLDKTTSARRIPQEDPEMEAVAMEFAKAYFANDTEAIVNHMTSRNDWELVLSHMVRNMYTGSYPGGWNESFYQIEDVTPYGLPWDSRPPVVYVTYSWEATYDKDVTSYSGRYSLVLYMAKTAEGWKVRFTNEDEADSYDPDLPKIRSVAADFSWDYAGGNVKWARKHMVSDHIDPPVHECTTPETKYVDGAAYTNTDTTIYYDPEALDPLTGELRAEVWVKFTTTDQDLNGHVLILNMVKKEDGWKIEIVSEG